MMEKKAFTLLEILIVVLILGILVNLAIPAIRGAVMKPRLARMLLDMSQIERTIFYLCYAEGTLEYGYPGGWWVFDNIDAFGEYYHVDVPERNEYFWYQLWIEEEYYLLEVYVRPYPYELFLFSKRVHLKDTAYYKKGERFWYVSYRSEWGKHLKALLPDDVGVDD